MPETQPAKKFDLKTHHFDARGRLKGKNPYRLHIRNGAKLFERPVNSGNLFYENNEPAGRVIMDMNDKGVIRKRYDLEAEHVAYTPPLTGAEKLSHEYEELKAKNEEMAKELAAIRAENEKNAEMSQAGKVAEEAKVEKDSEKSQPLAQTMTKAEPKTTGAGKAGESAASPKPASNYGDLL